MLVFTIILSCTVAGNRAHPKDRHLMFELERNLLDDELLPLNGIFGSFFWTNGTALFFSFLTK